MSYLADDAHTDGGGHALWEDGERVFRRRRRMRDDGNRSAVLVVLPAAEHPSRSSPDRAVEVGVEHLRTFGTEWSAHPTGVEARA
jgi:hypothetical protein